MKQVVTRGGLRSAIGSVPGSVSALALAVGSVPAFAQYSADGTVNTSAAVVRTLSITSATDLSFGTFSAGNSAGTVTMSAAGARSATGGVTLVTASTGSQSTISLSGTPSTSYSVSLPTTVQLTANGSAATMSLGSFTTTLNALQGSLNASGTGSFGIGGTLSVGANQAVATYTGSFTVTLNYN
jgi:hypothetical protein